MLILALEKLGVHIIFARIVVITKRHSPLTLISNYKIPFQMITRSESAQSFGQRSKFSFNVRVKSTNANEWIFNVSNLGSQ